MSPDSSASPDIIVIGAQKCGTTTLYNDLVQHPNTVLLEKELSPLISNDPTALLQSLVPRLRRPANSLLVDVSTEYAMRPRNNPAVAAGSIAPHAHIIYIVRDPIERVISHHHHEVSAQTMPPNIDNAVASYPALLDHSRYAYQLEPWIDRFPPQQVHIVHFEAYVSNRREAARALFQEVGLSPHAIHDPDTIHNAASGKRVAVGMGGRLSRNNIYRDFIRPHLPDSLKSMAKRALLPKAPPRPSPPSIQTIEYLVRHLTPEVHRLADYTRTVPWWDLEGKWLD